MPEGSGPVSERKEVERQGNGRGRSDEGRDGLAGGGGWYLVFVSCFFSIFHTQEVYGACAVHTLTCFSAGTRFRVCLSKTLQCRLSVLIYVDLCVELTCVWFSAFPKKIRDAISMAPTVTGVRPYMPTANRGSLLSAFSTPLQNTTH